MPEKDRCHKVTVRLSAEERIHLKTLVGRTGLSQEEYLRMLVKRNIPREMPSADFRAMHKILLAIGNSMNQIAARAHTIGFVDAAQYAKNAEELKHITLSIYKAVTSPDKAP